MRGGMRIPRRGGNPDGEGDQHRHSKPDSSDREPCHGFCVADAGTKNNELAGPGRRTTGWDSPASFDRRAPCRSSPIRRDFKVR
jgi:hypothetical protein